VTQNFSFHEIYSDEEPTAAGSDRAFGCTVGSILILIAGAKALMAEAASPILYLIFIAGAVLLLVGIAAPSRLSLLNKGWSKLGGTIAKVVNPVVLALLFFFVVTPMAILMRIAGKRPLRLAPDRSATSYWIERESTEGGPSTMRRQF
jgi:hypothetical protein